MRFEAIIFDLDGTLLNTLGDLADAVNFALSKRGHPPRTEAEVRDFIGNGIGKLIERALPPEAQAEADDCLADFSSHYRVHMADRTVPYAGVPALVEALHARGLTLAVLSNKVDEAAVRLVTHYFGEAFALVRGERAGVPRKPDPTSVHDILRTLQIDAARTLYVGDSGVDMETAKNAGLFAAGVTWGFRSREVLLTHGADVLVDRPEELFKFLEE